MSEGKVTVIGVYRRSPGTLEAEIGDELVTLDVTSGACFGFNVVAKTVWKSLAEPKSFEQLRDELLDQYDVGMAQCSVELRELLDDLLARGLVLSDR